jgi:hypothetical protein
LPTVGKPAVEIDQAFAKKGAGSPALFLRNEQAGELQDAGREVTNVLNFQYLQRNESVCTGVRANRIK